MGRWTFTLRDRTRGGVVIAHCLSDSEGNLTNISLAAPMLPADRDVWLKQLEHRPLDVYRDAEKLRMSRAGADGPLWFLDSHGRIVLAIPEAQFTVPGPPLLVVTMEDDEEGVAAVRLKRAN